MKYAMLIYPKAGSHEALGEDEYRTVNAEYWSLREDSRCLGGGHLQPGETATTVRYAGEENLIIDGPYADSKDAIGGFYIIEAKNQSEALEIGKGCPALSYGGSLEVREIEQM